jgi:drug/metabolite transporter (DMT)-like permease
VTHGNRNGILAIVAAMTLFAFSDTVLKLALADVPAGQLLFVRGIVLTIAGSLIVWRSGGFAQPRALIEPHTLLRGAIEAVAAFSFIAALAHIPLALNASINMATPLLVLPVAAAFLGERFGWRRVGAILVGFAGVLLILRPGAEGFDIWLAVSFLSAVLCAIRDVITRRIPQYVPSAVVTLVTLASVGAFGGAVAFLQGFVPMPGFAWFAIFASALISGTGMYCMVLSMRLGEVTVVSPFRYTGLISTTLLGWAVWGYLPDFYAWCGMALIVAAGLYALWRERKVKAE